MRMPYSCFVIMLKTVGSPSSKSWSTNRGTGLLNTGMHLLTSCDKASQSQFISTSLPKTKRTLCCFGRFWWLFATLAETLLIGFTVSWMNTSSDKRTGVSSETWCTRLRLHRSTSFISVWATTVESDTNCGRSKTAFTTKVWTRQMCLTFSQKFKVGILFPKLQ